jgi:CheY-like chemotaxis protein
MPLGFCGERTVVLLVDDDDGVLETTSELMQTLGYCVLTASNGYEALEVLREYNQVEVLFSDILMPGMDGERLAQAACALRPGLHVVLTSGGDGPRSDCTFVPKPYHAADLLAALQPHAMTV